MFIPDLEDGIDLPVLASWWERHSCPDNLLIFHSKCSTHGPDFDTAQEQLSTCLLFSQLTFLGWGLEAQNFGHAPLITADPSPSHQGKWAAKLQTEDKGMKQALDRPAGPWLTCTKCDSEEQGAPITEIGSGFQDVSEHHTGCAAVMASQTGSGFLLVSSKVSNIHVLNSWESSHHQSPSSHLRLPKLSSFPSLCSSVISIYISVYTAAPQNAEDFTKLNLSRSQAKQKGLLSPCRAFCTKSGKYESFCSISAMLSLYFSIALHVKPAWKHLTVNTDKEKLVVSREWKGAKEVKIRGGGKNTKSFLVIGFEGQKSLLGHLGTVKKNTSMWWALKISPSFLKFSTNIFFLI